MVSEFRLLEGYRALDLAEGGAILCGKLLADLGVDVIAVEKPEGNATRRWGPFYHDLPHPEKSLFWMSYSSNKRSITLNIETVDGQQILKRLVKTADIFIESFRPGYLDEKDLGYETLNQVNPQLIMASITPFGQDGPYRDYKAPDIVVWALGGEMYTCGDSDRPPVQIGLPQAYLCSGAEAAVGILMALWYRATTGEGQWVDLSAQQRVAWLTNVVPQWWELNKIIVERRGYGLYRRGAATMRDIWQCKDGYVAYCIMGGHIGAVSNQRTVEWMDEEGMAPEFLKAMNFYEMDFASVSQAEWSRMEEPIQKFFLNYSKAELYEQARRRHIFLVPVATAENLMTDPQTKARGFWQEVEYPELGGRIKFPGAWLQSSETKLQPLRRAPFIGEHNQEIYQEIGLTKSDMLTLKQAGVI